MKHYEVNFDGLIGPNHNYAGLAAGNLASAKNAKHVSHPKQAALEGLEKIRTLLNLGYKQGFLLPQQRPRLDILRNLGFSGSNTEVINKVAKQQQDFLPLVYSASSMWAANAATVSPSLDSSDGRVHFTPANLLTTNHRSIEHTETFKCLNHVFSDSQYFAVHHALHSQAEFADEGAANHTRLCASYDSKGVGLFVYGRDGHSTTQRFPARQTLGASQAIARAHGVKEDAKFLLQHPDVIDAGAFHNDVVAVGNGPLLFFHQDAFDNEQRQGVFAKLSEQLPFQALEVSSQDVTIEDAISSYLFNSQLLASPDGNMTKMRLIAPTECRDNVAVNRYLSALIKDTSQPIREVNFVDVRQSMSNGGGPACLRLRVVVNEHELAAVNQNFILNDEKINQLQTWVKKYYRDDIAPADLADPSLMDDCYRALDALTQILKLGSYYDFQK